MNVADFLREIVTALDQAGIPHMLTGSFASSLHGSPRSTQDLDIVIAPSKEALEKLLTLFPPGTHYYVDKEAAFDAFERKSQFNLISVDSGWKVDFIIRKGRPFSIREFERRSQARVMGVPVQMVSAEDLILAKLEWAAAGGSQRQIEDVAGVLRIQREKLDDAYLARGIRELGLEEEWEKARRLASPAP